MPCDDRIGVHEPYLKPEGRVVLHNVSRMLAAAFVAAMRVACASDATGGAVLQTLLQEATCGSTVEIPAGNYLVPHAVTIQGKTNCGNSGIYVGATSGVEIDGNSFQNCSSCRYSLADESTRYDIRIRNCRDVRLGPGNRTDKASDWLVLQETEHGRQGER